MLRVVIWPLHWVNVVMTNVVAPDKKGKGWVKPQMFGGCSARLLVHLWEKKSEPDVGTGLNQFRVEHLEPVDQKADFRFAVFGRFRRFPVFALQQQLGHRVDQSFCWLFVDGVFNLWDKKRNNSLHIL